MRLRWMAGSILVLAAISAGAVAMPDPSQYVWRSRVLLVFTRRADDPDLGAQTAAISADPAGARDRDLVVLTSIGAAAPEAALRRRYGVAAAGFAAVLIGKDGGVKLRSVAPMTREQVFQTIDAMPMRRSEIGRR